jgi:hypothetical protein
MSSDVSVVQVIDIEEDPEASPEDVAAAKHARHVAAMGRAEAALRVFELMTLDGDYEPSHAGVDVTNVVQRLSHLLEVCIGQRLIGGSEHDR